MLEIKKLGEKTIRIADTATGRCYMGSATYKASSVGGDTVCLQSIYEDNEPVFVARVADITIDGTAQADISACMVALNAFIGSFERAAANGGGGVSPSNDWILKIRTSQTPIEMIQAQVDELSRQLSKEASFHSLFYNVTQLTGRLEFKGLQKIIGSDALHSMFYSCNITYLGCPDLEEAGDYVFMDAFRYNRGLREIYFPKLSRINNSAFSNTFVGAVFLRKATIHPAMIKKGAIAYETAIYSANSLTDLTLTDIVTESSNLSEQTKLSPVSVLHVLNKLSTTTMGKVIQFGNIKIVATDPLKEQIRAAINARTNWTITGITLL